MPQLVFQCDDCGQIYYDKKDAIACENNKKRYRYRIGATFRDKRAQTSVNNYPLWFALSRRKELETLGDHIFKWKGV